MKLNEIFRLVLTSCAVIVAGCAAGPEIQWNEVVKISSGEQIVVKRGEKRRYVGAPFEKKGWLFQEAWIEGDLPSVGKFRWETSLRPFLLDRGDDGHWYLIGLSGHRSEYEYDLYHPRNETFFVSYRLDDGVWRRIVGSELPISLNTTKTLNLLFSGSMIFEPSDRYRYATEELKRSPHRFWNGDLLDLELKERVQRPLYPYDKYLFTLSPDRLDQGVRYELRCMLKSECGSDCSNQGGDCEQAYIWEDKSFKNVCLTPKGSSIKCYKEIGNANVLGFSRFNPNVGRTPKQVFLPKTGSAR